MCKTAGTLYLVPTPVGNLKDITQRALQILAQVKLVAAEDTRTTGKLLHLLGIKAELVSYHKFNEQSRSDYLLGLLQQGNDIALVTDAGSPGVSDPAEIIVKQAIDAGVTVTPLPGATAFVPALTGSGLSCDRFVFVGFLPTKQSECKTLLEQLKPLPFTLVFYEAPHRILKTIKLLQDFLGDRPAALARELTKMHESFYRGALSQLLGWGFPVKGEMVLLVGKAPLQVVSDTNLRQLLVLQLQNGASRKQAVNALKKQGYDRNRLYQLSLELDEIVQTC